MQSLSHDTLLGSEALDDLHRPALIDEWRVPALRFGDLRVHTMLACLLIFNLLPVSFANRQLRQIAAPLDKTLPTELARIVDRFDSQIDRLWRGQLLQA